MHDCVGVHVGVLMSVGLCVAVGVRTCADMGICVRM